ncbi:hypothetical protein HHI36_019514, partial [Cryptolaemus montrouzieri]
PISVIAPFNQGRSQNFTSSTKSLIPNKSTTTTPSGSYQAIYVKRNQSFSGFPKPHPSGIMPNRSLNFSENQNLNRFNQPLSAWNSLCRPYHSQNFLNRPPVPSIFYNLPPNFHFQSGNSTISGIPTQQIPNPFGYNFNQTIFHPNQNPFSFSSGRKNERKDSSRILSESSRNMFPTQRKTIDEKKILPVITPRKVNKESSVNKNIRHAEGNNNHSDSELQNADKFSSLELKKHKCYSPTFYSLRCKKHAKKRTLVYTLPKKVLSDGDLPNGQDSDNSDTESAKHYHIIPIPAPRCKKHRKTEIIYQNIAEVLRNDSLLDTSNESSVDLANGTISTTQAEVHLSSNKKPIISNFDDLNSKSSKSNTHSSIIISPEVKETTSSPTKSSTINQIDTRPKLIAVSPKKRGEIPLTSTIFKNSPTVRISPNLKPKNEIQKGALSIQIQARIKGSPNQNPSPNPSVQSIKSDSENTKSPCSTKTKDTSKNVNSCKLESENTKMPLLVRIKGSPNKVSPSPTSSRTKSANTSKNDVPKMPLLDTSESKWSPKFKQNNCQNAFYTLTAPHLKAPNMDLVSQYSATIPHPKHTKLIPRALFQEQQLPKSKSFSSKSKQKKHFQIPLQKCHSFKFQTAESYFQPIKNLHEENLMKNGYVSDYTESSRPSRSNKREKHKQKTNGPLVVMRPNDYQESLNFQENVHLQYPQPGLNSPLKPQTGKPNGLVYADLDMPNSNKKPSGGGTSKPKQQQKRKSKTEYATLQFNDIGQEIDV